MSKYICIHSHFYQPPRENPWLEQIQPQESAWPFKNWNERISSECYRENGRSRIINADNVVVGFSNNYAKMSFNMGPTLLSWMEEHDPRAYEYVLQGDALSVKKFNGHGNAIAQCYNHIIMPLANRRDKETQVIWGIKDFEKRFNRPPEAMWLPETAVDTESLEVLAEHGMKYVILAPRQASRVRKIGSEEWIDVTHEKINTRMPYRISLPSGRSIAAFFYDGSISKAVAFDGLLHDGGYFAHRLMKGFNEFEESNQLVHIATDGESYGHHHKLGDMALAFALKNIEEHTHFKLCNYGYFLELQPPTFEVKIFEDSSWSCAHGIERWRSDCGCNSGARSNWNQKWRAPLRAAFDELRDSVNIYFEKTMADFKVNGWEARNDFINAIINRTESSNRAFIERWVSRTLSSQEEVNFIKAFEIQRQLLLMYTSCAWFFDEVSGIETVQVMQYALRAIELSEEVWGPHFKEKFVAALEKIPSNIPEYVNATGVFERYVKKAQMNFLKIAVHYAVIGLFEELGDNFRLYSFDIKKKRLETYMLGNNKILYGQAHVRSLLTFVQKDILFAAIHLGENIIVSGISELQDESEYETLKIVMDEHIGTADFTGIMKEMSEKFGKRIYSLKDLLPDKRNYLIKDILAEKIKVIKRRHVRVYQENYALVSFLNSLQIEVPPAFKASFEYVLYENIIEAFKEKIENLNTHLLEQYMDELKKGNFHLPAEDIRMFFQQKLIDYAEVIKKDQYNAKVLDNFLFSIKLAKASAPGISWSEIQYIIFSWKQNFETIPVPFAEKIEAISQALKIK